MAGEELIAAAEKRVQESASLHGGRIVGFAATALFVELRNMYNVGYEKGYEDGQLDEPYNDVRLARQGVPFGRAPKGLGGHSSASGD